MIKIEIKKSAPIFWDFIYNMDYNWSIKAKQFRQQMWRIFYIGTDND